MKLSLRISITIALISMLISAFVATLSYFNTLDASTQQSQLLVKQLANSQARTSGIAAYLQDTELAQEIVDGLSSNDMISSALITTLDNKLVIGAKTPQTTSHSSKISLPHPFFENELLGHLEVFPDNQFILMQARSSSLQTAYLLLALSLATSIIVGIFIRNKLTLPLKSLADEFLKVDVSQINKLYTVDIGYKRRDEIGLLVKKVNTLILALQTQYKTEYELRKSTEEVQKRFRLIFEQSTAGIGLLDSNGIVTIANAAMNQLMGESMVGKVLANQFENPHALNDQLEQINQHNYSQMGFDLVNYHGSQKRHLHCILSTISESRTDVRKSSDQLVKVMIYDVTERQEQESKTRYEADHDSLTGLLNRRAGIIQLNQQLGNLQKTKDGYFSLIMIDLDKFKPVNDEHGHDAGDVLLKKVSERLQGISSSCASVCVRWGGDEFLVGVQTQDDSFTERYIKSLIELISKPVEITPDLNVSVGASIGAIITPSQLSEGQSVDELVKLADDLMYKIKQNGKNDYLVQHLS